MPDRVILLEKRVYSPQSIEYNFDMANQYVEEVHDARQAYIYPALELYEAKDAFVRCEDNLQFMRELPSDNMKLIVTSPPYNLGKAYERRKSIDKYLTAQSQVISECFRLLHPQGSICWQVGNHIGSDGEVIPLDILLYAIFKSQGLHLRNRIVWHFEHGLHCSKRFSGRYETILWFTKGSDYTFRLDPVRVPSKYPQKKYFKGPKRGELSGNPLGKNPGDVWIVPNVKANHVEKTIHPCQFPVELIERLVQALTNPRDSVFDPYMGVGSAILAALMHDRIGYGCDTEEQYVQIARDRIIAFYNGTLRTRPMGKSVYDPRLPYGGHK
jgi:adenine-specific DNA-methyltransferase